MKARVPRPSQVVRINGSEVGPGTRAQIDLPLVDLSTRVPLTMSVHVVNGRRDGPQLFVSAAVHGDELNGVEIIRRVVKLSALKRLRGALIAVPIINVPGLSQSQSVSTGPPGSQPLLPRAEQRLSRSPSRQAVPR